MLLPYNDVYSVFLNKVVDYDFVTLGEQFIQSQMSAWLRSGASNPRIRAKFSSIVFDDEILEIEFELKNPVDEQADMDFVTEVLARAMIVEWLEPQVKTVLLTKQMFGGHEEKWFAQSNHLGQMQSLLKNTQVDLQKLLRDHGYLYNSYVSEVNDI